MNVRARLQDCHGLVLDPHDFLQNPSPVRGPSSVEGVHIGHGHVAWTDSFFCLKATFVALWWPTSPTTIRADLIGESKVSPSADLEALGRLEFVWMRFSRSPGVLQRFNTVDLSFFKK